MNETTLDKTDVQSRLLASFENFEKELNGKSNTLLHSRRKEAINAFTQLGFPTTKNEEWKYTDIKGLLKQDFDFVPSNTTSHLAPADLESLLIQEADANIIIFINGVYNPALSKIVSPAEELVIQDFSEAYASHTELIDKYFAKFANYEKDAFTALNTAFVQQGIFIHVPANKVVVKPVMLYFISDTSGRHTSAMPRNLFIADKNSQVSIVESFQSRGEYANFTNIVTEIVLHENAIVDFYKIQNENTQAYTIGTTQVYQSRDSKFSSTTVSLNGSLIRNNLNIVLDAQNCEANLFGLYLLYGNQHVDNHTLVDHAKPHSYSNELYKGILDGKSTGVFNGKIFVRQDAQKTNAFQSNRNILLSKDASMNTKPQLEIFADDVKCSHGATTGQLDEDMLFYLRARGIGEEKAKALLMYAFAGDVINHIKIDSVRHYVEEAIAQRLS